MWGQLRSPSASHVDKETSSAADTEIKVKLLEALLKDVHLRDQGVSVTVAGGTVVFSGEVSDPKQKEALEALARQVAGIRQVINNVTVKNLSTAGSAASAVEPNPDDQLAKAVEFALYKTDAFDLKLMKVTSQDGVVQLKGDVRTIAEKLLAERIAREVEGVKSVANDLSLASASK
jgi:osmotically-inducible protein OsmY